MQIFCALFLLTAKKQRLLPLQLNLVMAVYTSTEALPAFKNPVITIGTFDGVHIGHKTILKEIVDHAKEVQGESILLTFEPHPRKVIFPDKPLQLLTPLEEKLELVKATGVDHIVVVPFTKEFANLTAEEYVKDFLVAQFKPHSIVIGYDHQFGNDRKGDINLLKQLSELYNYKVFEISAQLIHDAAVSSTKVRKAVSSGDMAEATNMLGRPYSLTGEVVKGAQLGNTIGYPTANVKPSSSEQILPANGVYAVKVIHDGNTYNAMLNIGIRPTVSNELSLHIEANIFDFEQDIYGQQLTLQFIARLRDEQKFPSIDDLKQQLGKDKEAALKVLLS